MNDPARENIEAIAQLERDFLENRTTADRVADVVAAISGSMGFVLGHALTFVLWFLVNHGKIPFLPAFDPYPHVLLATAVSCEAVLLSTFVLMKQNRMSRRAEQRDHLHLQVNLLAEREITKLLQMQRQICQRLGIREAAEDENIAQLSEETAVDLLARELAERLPGE